MYKRILPFFYSFQADGMYLAGWSSRGWLMVWDVEGQPVLDYVTKRKKSWFLDIFWNPWNPALLAAPESAPKTKVPYIRVYLIFFFAST